MEKEGLSKNKQEGRNRQFIIRKAEKEDYEFIRTLVELDLGLHQQARPDYFKVSTVYTKEEFLELLALLCPICWVAVEDKRVTGLCFGRIEATAENPVCKSRRVAFVEDLVTLPECRGQGIATALMAQARKQAVEEGAETLELCVWGFNQAALGLYEQLGMNVQYYRLEEKL